jgi:hypothetical protein
MMELLDVVMPVDEGRFIPHEALVGRAYQGFSMLRWVSTQHSGVVFEAPKDTGGIGAIAGRIPVHVRDSGGGLTTQYIPFYD